MSQRSSAGDNEKFDLGNDSLVIINESFAISANVRFPCLSNRYLISSPLPTPTSKILYWDKCLERFKDAKIFLISCTHWLLIPL